MLIFIYDKLMIRQEQELTGINLQFVSFGQLQGKPYWITDTKKKRIFCIPSKGRSTKLIYGGLFIVKNYEYDRLKLHSYYNNSIQYTTRTLPSDLYDLAKVTITPIKFDSLINIENNIYSKGRKTECSCFVGNPINERIKFNIARGKYYGIRSVDSNNFITMIKENANVKS